MSQLSRLRLRAAAHPPLSPIDVTPFADTIKTLKDRGVPTTKIARFFVCDHDQIVPEIKQWRG